MATNSVIDQNSAGEYREGFVGKEVMELATLPRV
jgi:hypothetical protein